MIPEAIENRLRQHQIPSLRGRTAAIRQLVLQASAPVVAVMLGYNHDHIARLVAEAGGTWNRYAAAITPSVTRTQTHAECATVDYGWSPVCVPPTTLLMTTV